MFSPVIIKCVRQSSLALTDKEVLYLKVLRHGGYSEVCLIGGITDDARTLAQSKHSFLLLYAT